ncbi:molybdenum cofactor guanylyltransferase [Paenibacillus cremeus]|uniref:Molybdenum cofactor guanylyltransferase n=1 Tax=Paenibacillus cremeus TaxID=2163881 RepID=A0A559JGL4_9BACL|nr:molybdenum cofactor guanylyltransferase [Paenibacillus cremeus]TVX99014.1 molybdenum cofactor guanylyltransferase [Paenibacillus cremeus]
MMSGLILAGGPSKQMGGHWKALLPMGGEALIRRQIREMRKVCKEIIVATQDPKPFLREVDTKVRIITDYYPGHGPLGGMHAGFSLSQMPDIWVVSSDMPFISAHAAQVLWLHKQAGFDAAIPSICGCVYPFHGVYDKSCGTRALSLIQQGEKQVSELLKLKELLWSEVPDAAFADDPANPPFIERLDTWEDYHRAEQFLLGLGPSANRKQIDEPLGQCH